MVDTRNNITVPSNDWLDVYTETSIAVGTDLLVQNIGQTEVLYVIAAAKPTDLSKYKISGPGNSVDRWIQTGAGQTGLWVRSRVNDGLINVEEA